MTAPFLWAAGVSNNGLQTAVVTWMSTELTSLGIASNVISTASGATGIFSNGTTGQAIWGVVQLNVGNPGVGAVTSGGSLSGWFLQSFDGSLFEGLGTTVNMARSPDFTIPLPATTIASGAVFGADGLVLIPALNYKVFIQNNLGVALNGTTTAPTIKVGPIAMQY